MKDVSLRDLLEAGCHFGHQTTRWNPKMRPFIFSARDRIHIFDLVKTKTGLEEAREFLRKTAATGGSIIYIGTKRQAIDLVKASAISVGMPYITERWIGGLITNWSELKKRIKRLADLKAGKAEGKFKELTKKENILIDRQIAKLERTFGGVADLKEVPAAVFVIDARKEMAALKEAKVSGIKTVAILDTNSDPDLVDFPIPANDDAIKSIELITNMITQAIEEGLKNSEVKKVAEGAEVSEVSPSFVKASAFTKVTADKSAGKQVPQVSKVPQALGKDQKSNSKNQKQNESKKKQAAVKAKAVVKKVVKKVVKAKK